MLRFDHVIRAVPDLDAASNLLLAEQGLDSVAGGRHSGHGTANRLVPLGHDYLELVAVVDPLEAAESPFGLWVGAHSSPGSLSGLCLRTWDIEAEGRRLDLAPVAMSRTRPDGGELNWRLLGMDVGLEKGLPFFIEWDVDPQDHPGRLTASHRVGPRRIAWVELGGDVRKIERWLGPNDLNLRIVDGPPGVHRVGLATESGELIF
ncbi:MAG: VOC family protein [Acidimicrobiia bacterium]|nr:VOC family protein [Acidimicrobiia bacterium]